MDAVLGFLLTLPIYVAICVALAAAFVFADRRVRRHARRPGRCESCGADVDLAAVARRGGRCPACGRVQAAWRRDEDAEEA